MEELILQCDWKGGENDTRVQFSASQDEVKVSGGVVDLSLAPSVANSFQPGRKYRVTFEEVEE